MNNYDKNDMVYHYSMIYDISKNRYSYMEFESFHEHFNPNRYNNLSGIVTDYIDKKLSIGIRRKSIEDTSEYYEYDYRDNNGTISSKLLMSNLPFTNPLLYFNYVNKAPMKNISRKLIMKYGFSVTEDIPYGFIYHECDDSICYAKKYGLKNTGEIDYSKLITEYSTTNDILMVKNYQLEQYNYIAVSSKEAPDGAIMSLENPNNSNFPNIYLNNNPTCITISKRFRTNHRIHISYDENGITNSMTMNNIDEQCLYHVEDNNRIISSHPLVYEPFYEDLYKDIILDDIPYTVIEIYHKSDDYITYDRIVSRR